MKWLGQHPFTVGECDEETGQVLWKRTYLPGEEILPEHLNLVRSDAPLVIHDEGDYSDSLVEKAMRLENLGKKAR